MFIPLPTQTLALFGLPGNTEWILILVLGVLIFGRRLPEVGRSLGRSIVEFKKGIKGIEDEIDEASNDGSGAAPAAVPPANAASGTLPGAPAADASVKQAGTATPATPGGAGSS